MYKLENCKHLVISGLRKEWHLSHFTFSEAIEIIQKVKPEKGYLTHISHQLGLYKEVQKELPENIQLAYDGLVIYYSS